MADKEIDPNYYEFSFKQFMDAEATTATAPTSLTMEDFQKAIDLIRPVLYYVESEYVQEEYIFLLRASEYYPEHIYLNPLDFGRVKNLISWRTLKVLDRDLLFPRIIVVEE